jgi:hypothetical protein
MKDGSNPILVNTYGTNAPDAAKFGVGATVPDQRSGACVITPDVVKATEARREIAADPRMRDQR